MGGCCNVSIARMGRRCSHPLLGVRHVRHTNRTELWLRAQALEPGVGSQHNPAHAFSENLDEFLNSKPPYLPRWWLRRLSAAAHGMSRGWRRWAQEMLTVKQQMPFVNSNISYTVQIIGIILSGCLKKKKRREKERKYRYSGN